MQRFLRLFSLVQTLARGVTFAVLAMLFGLEVRGAVSRIEWDPVPEMRPVGEAFATGFTVRDESGRPVESPVEGVAVRASVFESNPERTVLGGVPHNYDNNAGRFTIGWSFTPKHDLRVTALRAYFGVRIQLKSSAGKILASEEIPEGNGTWRELRLPEAVWLKAGQIYHLEADTGNLSYFASRAFDQPSVHSDDLDIQYTNNFDLWLVDFAYTRRLGADVVSPGQVTTSSGGIWRGNLAVGAAGGYVVLEAEVQGVVGFSAPFQVDPPNNLRLTQTLSTTTATVGDPVTFTLRASNGGPATLSQVTVSHQWAEEFELLNVAQSKGGYVQEGLQIKFQLGDLQAREEVELQIIGRVRAAGVLSQSARIEGDSPDPLPSDNQVRSEVRAFGVPELLPSDVVVFTRASSGLGTNAVFEVVLTAPSSRPVTVRYYTEAGSAVEGEDYERRSGTLHFLPGDLKQWVSIPVAAGTQGEANEQFFLKLEAPANAQLGRSEAICRIINPQLVPTVTVAPVTLAEGDVPFGTEAVFRFRMSHPMDVTVVGEIRAMPGTAQEMRWPIEPGESDFYVVWGGFGFEPGRTETTIAVPIHGDDFPEPNESFQMVYWSNMAATPNSQAIATIVNDDPIPAVTVGEASVRENTVGPVTLVFPVVLSKAMSTPVSFRYRPVGLSATEGIDFSEEPGLVTLEAGEREASVRIEVLPDRLVEGIEELTLVLEDPVGCVLVQAGVTGRIEDAASQIPKSEFLSPAYGSSHPAGSAIPIRLEATDPDGRVVRLTLSVDGELRSYVETNSLEFAWVPQSPGHYRLTARAWDDQGASASSAEWSVQVVSASRVLIVAPAHQSRIPLGQPVVVQYRYRGDPGIQRVELWVDGAEAVTVGPGVSELVWNNGSEGRHEIEVRVVDVDGNVHRSDPMEVTLGPAAPANDQFAESTTLAGFMPVALGSNRGATVEAGEPLHGSPSARASVWWNWTAPASGTVTLVATNAAGGPLNAAVYTGDIRTFLARKAQVSGRGSFEATAGERYHLAVDSVGPETGPLTLALALAKVEIVTPRPAERFRAPATVALDLSNNAPDGVIRQVEFFDGPTRIGVATEAPFRWTWRVESNGYYQVRAVATDELGGVRSSSTVPFVVTPRNDHVTNAVEVSGYRVEMETSNVGASRDGDPRYADNQGGHSIWYRWIVPEDGICTVFGRGAGGFDLLLGAFAGTTVNPKSHLAVNALGGWHVPMSFQVVQGTVVHFLIDGMFGEEGVIQWWMTLRPGHDDIAAARRIRGSFFEAVASHRGATAEPFEAALHPAESASVWWWWEAPATAITAIQAFSTAASTQIRVYQGTVGNLVPVVSQTEWATHQLATFRATEGQGYFIAVLGQSGNTNDYRLKIQQELVRLDSPQNRSAYPASTPVLLSAAVPDLFGAGLQVEFLVNNVVVATVPQAPYEVIWPGGAAGTYRFQARARRADGTLDWSLAATVLLYEGNQVPKPSLVLNSRGGEGLVANSVGQLFVFGPGDMFAIPGSGESGEPRPGFWPEGVTQWAKTMGGMGDVLEYFPESIEHARPFGTHHWTLTADGVLYKDGSTRLPFPPGVTRWRAFHGAGNCLAVGDDGVLYLDGATPVNPSPRGVRWKDIAMGYIYHALLSEEGEVFMLGRDALGQPVHRVIPAPPGVRFTEMKASVYALLLRGTDGVLYQTGDPRTAGSLAGALLKPVPLPAGVTRFSVFALGGFHALAIGDDGELYTWGRNWEGQLGVGTQEEARTQLQKVAKPPGVTAWTDIAGGSVHSMAIGNDCSLYSWGANDAYQLGVGKVPAPSLPQRVPGMEGLCGIPVVYTQGETTRLEDGSFRLRFDTSLNRSYQIQYSEDVQEWRTVFPSVTGSGGVMEWIDDGPPKSWKHPAAVEHRFYRVIFTPSQ